MKDRTFFIDELDIDKNITEKLKPEFYISLPTSNYKVAEF